MREIKFRAFHKPSKIMYWFDLMWGNNGHGNGWIGMVPFGEPMTNRSHRDNVTNVDPTDCEIMQFTGLKDINGTDIYEGDIVSTWTRADLSGKRTHKFNQPIEWGVCGDYHGYDISYLHTATIIGNIHQNPELL